MSITHQELQRCVYDGVNELNSRRLVPSSQRRGLLHIQHFFNSLTLFMRAATAATFRARISDPRSPARLPVSRLSMSRCLRHPAG